MRICEKDDDLILEDVACFDLSDTFDCGNASAGIAKTTAIPALRTANICTF